MKPEECATLWHEALEAGKAAAIAENERLGPEGKRGLDCGWGWVMLKPARGPFVSYLKRLGVGKSVDWGSAGRGYWIPGSTFHSLPTQSFSVDYKACQAAAEVLKRAGLSCYATYRLD